MSKSILIVDDEEDIRMLVADIVEEQGFKPLLAANSLEALTFIDTHIPSACLLDIWLQNSELDGLGILAKIRQRHPSMPVVVMSGHGNIQTAVEAIKRGAYDYIEKPFNEERLIIALKRALETSRLRVENTELRRTVRMELEWVGSSQYSVQIRHMIDKLAITASRVLLIGQPGTGKSHIVRLVHHKSKRAIDSLIVLNAAHIAEGSLSEAQLFGEEEETPLGRRIKHIGLIERAHNGTLYIDNIGLLPMSIQLKLLRLLQEQTIDRVGGVNPVKLDIRVMSSHHESIQPLVDSGHFKQELFYRLSVVQMSLLPLIQHAEDIPDLLRYFTSYFAEQMAMSVRKWSESALIALQVYAWPGDIRQLRNMVEQVMILSQESDEAVSASMLPVEVLSVVRQIHHDLQADHILSLPLREAREFFEKQYLMLQIQRFGGNISRTASFIGMERTALHRKLKMLGVAYHALDEVEEEAS
jgi:two-component system nitrogen regulation response regulator NtrX